MEQPAPVTKPRVLAVDDDQEILDLLQRGLAIEGFDVPVARDGQAALAALAAAPVDVVVLDIMMPGPDGLQVLRRIRESSDVPVLFLSARDRVRDRIAGLDAGADDYLPKPFSFDELTARLRALLRRHASEDREILVFGELWMDLSAREVRRDGRPIRLTHTEFDLLLAFIRQPNRVLSREALRETVWGGQPTAVSNVVDVYVGYLRRKLEDGGRSRLIHTVRGMGYVLRKAGT
jgi:two-component system response regulator MprA